jgi:hypothetical protein
VTGLPSVSSAVYPKSRSAPLFQLVMMPFKSLLRIASSDPPAYGLTPSHSCRRDLYRRRGDRMKWLIVAISVGFALWNTMAVAADVKVLSAGAGEPGLLGPGHTGWMRK